MFLKTTVAPSPVFLQKAVAEMESSRYIHLSRFIDSTETFMVLLECEMFDIEINDGT